MKSVQIAQISYFVHFMQLYDLKVNDSIILQTAPEMFPFEEYPVTETKTTTDVHFPGAACLIVTCKTDPKATKKE